MKNIYRILSSFAVAALLLTSCDIAPISTDSQLLASAVSASTSTIDVAALGGSSTFNVTAQGDWIVNNTADWLTVSPMRGSGATTVTVSADANVDEDYQEVQGPRSAVINICGTGVKVPVTINQDGEKGLDSKKLYKKITKAEEFDHTKSFLLVVNNGTATLAAKPYTPKKDGDYSYIYADDVTDRVSGDEITMPNASNAFFFKKFDEGKYGFQMSNMYYIYQAAKYNNFYFTQDFGEADEWSVTFNDKGEAIITNITCSKIFQYSVAYSSFGAYSSAQDYAVYPVLYMDSQAPTTEVLQAETNVAVPCSATSASIEVKSNATWKVRCHDSWIKSFTKYGEGDGKIDLTFDANTSKTDPKVASITLLGETTKVDIIFVQNKVATTVAEIAGQLTSTSSKAPSAYEAELEGAVVSYVNGGNVFIEDESGAILLYLSNSGLSAGDCIKGHVAGTGYIYNGLPEITSLGKDYEKTSGADIPLTEVTIADLIANYSSYMSRRIKIKGVTVTKAITATSQDGTISQNGKDITLRSYKKGQCLITAGCEGDVICYPSIYNTTKQLMFYSLDDFTFTKMATEITAPANLTVSVGKNASIGATVNSGAALSYSSKNGAIATVDASGVVSGVAVGETEVVIKAAAIGAYPAAEKTVKVTVSEAAGAAVFAEFFGANISYGTAVKLADYNWTFTVEGTDKLSTGTKDLGKQFGTKSVPATKLTLKCTDYTQSINMISVETSCASNVGPVIDYVSVGGTKLTAPASTALEKGSNKKFTFTSSSLLKGDIEIVWKSSAAAGIYVKSVGINQ